MNKLKLILACLLIPLSAACAEVVEEGHVGIEKRLGEMDKVGLAPGMYWYNPITTSIEEVNTQTQIWSSQTETYTRDLQQATVDFTLNYALTKENAPAMYSQFGEEWQQRIIPPIVTAKIKEVFGQNPAVGVIANRQDVQTAIKNAIVPELEKRNIDVDNFEITDVSFSVAYENAVEAKEVAVQNAQRAKNVTVQKEEEARQAVITANGEAEAMRVRANALASNPKLVEYEAVQKWNGKLCPSNSTCIYGEGGAVPFVNIK